MATTRCDECGAKVSPSDSECPECGAEIGSDSPPVRSRDVKVRRWTGLYAWISVMLAITILGGVSGPLLIHYSENQDEKIEIRGEDGKPKKVQARVVEQSDGSKKFEAVGKRDSMKLAAGIGLTAIATGAGASLLVLSVAWLYRAWALVPDELGGPSPTMAVLLLFIPIFNFYWVFRAIPGLSSAYQEILEELAPGKPPKAGRGLGLIASVLLFVPLLNVLSIFLFLAWLDRVNYARNRIIAISERKLDPS